MNSKKAKQPRKIAKQSAENAVTSYVNGYAYANGQSYDLKLTKRLDPKCIRGEYKALKKEFTEW
jgi:hypothetical protein